MAKAGLHLIKKCVKCDNDYTQYRSDQMYCSHKCLRDTINERNRNRIKKKKTCIYCNKEFTPNVSSAIYCSEKCRYEKRKKVIRETRTKILKDGFIWVDGKQQLPRKKCKVCNSDFYCAPCYEKRGGQNGSFCSRLCYMKDKFNNNIPIGGHRKTGSKSGKRIDLDNRFFRSSWEANYARYLNFLIQHNEIMKWEYEVDTFQFTTIKRGTRFYTPDFKVYSLNGSYCYHEVKGWMDDKSKTKLSRMKKFYPDEKVIIIDGTWFKKNGKKLSPIIPFWEKPSQKII